MKASIQRVLPTAILIAAALVCTALVIMMATLLGPIKLLEPVKPSPDLLTELRTKGSAAMPVDGLDYVYVTARLTNPDRICTSMLKNANTPPLSMHCYPVFEKSK